MLQKLIQFEKNRYPEGDGPTIHLHMETLVQKWLDHLKQTVYCLTESGDVEVISH
jgi:hypothetical protein